jgi:hypothetical protein
MTRRRTGTSGRATKRTAAWKGSPYRLRGWRRRRGADAPASAPRHFGMPPCRCVARNRFRYPIPRRRAMLMFAFGLRISRRISPNRVSVAALISAGPMMGLLTLISRDYRRLGGPILRFQSLRLAALRRHPLHPLTESPQALFAHDAYSSAQRKSTVLSAVPSTAMVCSRALPA